jgi:hypothetical protein
MGFVPSQMEESMTTVTFRSTAFKLVAGWMALGVALASPISAYAENGTTRHTHHRAVYLMVDPPAVTTTSHGRGAPTEQIFSRNAADCNKALCIGY